MLFLTTITILSLVGLSFALYAARNYRTELIDTLAKYKSTCDFADQASRTLLNYQEANDKLLAEIYCLTEANAEMVQKIEAFDAKKKQNKAKNQPKQQNTKSKVSVKER